jgi:phosphate transport system permease protein
MSTMQRRKIWERLIEALIRACGYSAVLFVALILFFLLQEGLPTFGETPISSLFGMRWYPNESLYGLLPLIVGSLVVTFGAAIIAMPLGLASALFIAEVAPRWLREILKPLIEILAGMPSVVLGFLGVLVLVPILRETLNLPTGLTAFTGSLLLAGMALPTIVSVAEDALDSVPKSFRDGALALGATKWQTTWRVTLPAARSGVMTAMMLGLGRAIGETMAVMMVTGNAPQLRFDALFVPMRTMTATIATEMGEVANGSAHYHVLFTIGIVLFVITFLINLLASSMLFRAKKRAERMLS